jgi:predicted O-methyltransferase YrrM
MSELKNILVGDLGVSGYPLHEAVSKYRNSTIVELGTYTGESTQVFLLDAEQSNNVVNTVDVSFHYLPSHVRNNGRLRTVLGDSATVGQRWIGSVDVLFVDTFHIAQQVLCELYYWYPHMREGGLIAFHDTNWPSDKHDTYGGIQWPRPEEAIKEFFGITSLNYEDDFIKVTNHPEGWGLTLVWIKKKANHKANISRWEKVFQDRNHLISLFWNEANKGEVTINLSLQPDYAI